ncbi:MAG: thiamine pyrophosphate-binding protein [Deltaproteobacteria bacterium]|nr:MAG: thiamine pyrophosphate-binding protein [Deltaproteobacteria bacterium]
MHPGQRVRVREPAGARDAGGRPQRGRVRGAAAPHQPARGRGGVPRWIHDGGVAVTEAQRPSRVVDLVLRYLKAEGVRVVYGIPGGLLHTFFEAVEADPDLALVVAKHEEGAAFMADGYARTSGRLAVCAGTSGPGATNLLTGVSVAFADGVPMMVITGQAASHALGKGAAQETTREDIDVVAMFRPVTKYSTMVPTADVMPHHLRRALRLALSGRPGPVHLNVPIDLWRQPAPDETWFDPSTYRPKTDLFDRRAVQDAAEALQSAARPVILAGSGTAVAGAAEHLATLAEMFPARVATTPRAKGLFPEDHPLSLGVLGFAGHAAARKTIIVDDDVDVLVTVGASLNETTTYNWHPGLMPTRALIQVDIDVDRIGRNYPVTIPVVGDARTILTELVYHTHRLIREGRRPASTWADAPPVPRGEDRFLDRDLRASDAIPLTPQRWRRELSDALPEDAIVFSDIGGHMLFNIHHLTIRGRQRFVLNLGFGSMGHGTVAPIGAAMAHPGRPVVAIVGDACFTMNGMELLTALEYDVPVVWVIENNNMHGITWHGSQKVSGGRPMDSVVYRHKLDIAAIARAMGLHAALVDRPGELAGALDGAWHHAGPSVIEVRVDPSIEPPLGDRAQTIAGFKR